jgi:hypothetical protein
MAKRRCHPGRSRCEPLLDRAYRNRFRIGRRIRASLSRFSNPRGVARQTFPGCCVARKCEPEHRSRAPSRERSPCHLGASVYSVILRTEPLPYHSAERILRSAATKNLSFLRLFRSKTIPCTAPDIATYQPVSTSSVTATPLASAASLPLVLRWSCASLAQPPASARTAIPRPPIALPRGNRCGAPSPQPPLAGTCRSFRSISFRLWRRKSRNRRQV